MKANQIASISLVLFISLVVIPIHSNPEYDHGKELLNARILQNTLSTYSNDDGNPATFTATTYAQARAFVKGFPSVTVPANSDLVVKYYLGSINSNIGAEFRIGNGVGYNFSGSYATYDFNIASQSGTAGWHSFIIANASSILSNGFVLVNVTASYFTTGSASAYMYYDSTANSASYTSWLFLGGWYPKTGLWVYFVRLSFIQHSTNADYDYALTQLQLGCNLTASGSVESSTKWFRWSATQVADGSGTISTTSAGWISANNTRYQWLNFSFRNRVVVGIGDSIMAGQPYHSSDPSFYGASDDQTKCMEYRLGLLLGQNVINKGIGGETTTQILARLYSDALDYGPDYVMVEGGLNDITTGASVATITGNLHTMYDDCIAANAHVLAWTVTPKSDYSSSNKAKINQTNDWIRNQSSDDITVIDSYNVVVNPALPGSLLAAYDSGDHAHLSQAGYYAIANYTYLTAFASTASVSTNYLVDHLTFEQNIPGALTQTCRPHTVNVSYRNGFLMVALANSTVATLDFPRVNTSYINISFTDGWKVGSQAFQNLGIGEIRIFGLPITYVNNGFYAGVWSNLSVNADHYGKMPYPRSAVPLATANASSGTVNVTVNSWNMAATWRNALVASWTVIHSSSANITYTIANGNSECDYVIYAGTTWLDKVDGPVINFSSSLNATFNVKALTGSGEGNGWGPDFAIIGMMFVVMAVIMGGFGLGKYLKQMLRGV